LFLDLYIAIKPTITYLFNKLLELGRVPKDWLDAHIVPVFKKGTHIVPVFKKGNKNKPSNYLPVSLTFWLGTLSKAFTEVK
jgi:hypothetical protein